MRVIHTLGELEVEFDLENPIDISIPMLFDGPQPNAYGVEPASSRTCEYGDLVGDTRRGGSCNFERYSLIPHCNGTHTECIGHITDERISVGECLQKAFFPAVLITVTPVPIGDSGESYSEAALDPDLVITSRTIDSALKSDHLEPENFSALIVRTLPNSEDKLSTPYVENIPPYFTEEAILFLDSMGIDHLICDLPSIDRLHDGGKLLNHRKLWNVPAGSNEAGPGSRRDRTVTELTFVPDAVTDGIYLLNIQIAPFHADAAPSRPVIFPTK